MLLENSQANGFGSLKNRSTGGRSANGRGQGDDRSNVSWPLTRHRACNYPSEAVTDKVNFPSGLGPRSLYGLVEMALNQEIRALGVDPDAGKIGPVSDAPQPS